MAPILEMYDFIKNCKDKHLTLGDIRKMSPGETIDVVIWDTHFEEHDIWDNMEEDKSYDAQEFFKSNRNQITYLDNYEWNIHFNYGETLKHPVHVIFEENNCWREIINNTVRSFNFEYNSTVSLTPIDTFPDCTRVGWRGPIMLWDKLDNLPQVYLRRLPYLELS